MRAQVARRDFHLDGRGIKIGVISDSFNAFGGAKADVLSGDLPGPENPLGYKKPVRVLQDNKSQSASDEGRAMLQIIADVAPGAELLFHSARTETQFARAVKALTDAGANIIVDDLGFSSSPFFQDGVAAQAVTAAAKRGVTYFSAAGNDSNRSYQSVFRPSTTFTLNGVTYEAHNFASGTGIDLFQDITLPVGSEIDPLLGWDQPSGKVTSDFELFLVSSSKLPTSDADLLRGSVPQLSGQVQQPLKLLSYQASSTQTVYLIIARKVGSANSSAYIKWISSANGADSGVVYQYVNDGNNQGASTIYGQPNAAEAIAVGAVEVDKTPLRGVNPPVLDGFSSTGGTPIFFDAAGNRLQTAEVRRKPELVGPNGVDTTLTFNPPNSFSPFFGTSAAAPHVAAVAALVLQRAGGPKSLSSAQILQLMQRTAIPLDSSSNFRSGAGLVQADAAVLAAYQNQIISTASNAQITGTDGADNIYSSGSNDTLIGGRGNDALFGSDGDDVLIGGPGNDYLVGGSGNDRLVGGKGDDTLLAGPGNDTLMGGPGNDLLAGGTGRNQLWGGNGENTFVLCRDGLAVVHDFQVGRDRLALDGELRFQQLQQVQRGSNLLIQWQGQSLARLLGVTTTLPAADFSSISITS